MFITRTHRRDLFTTAEAVYSDCEKYRYRLVIEWDKDAMPAMVIGLNPSTATEMDNDPTITRLERWARRNGLGSLWMFNAYAFRSTDPNGLWTVEDPCGPENLDLIGTAVKSGMCPVLAWGNNIQDSHQTRVMRLLSTINGPLPKCFKVTQEGHPWHPLYLSDADLDGFKDFMP